MTHCATCGVELFDASPTSPAVRYCETHWWANQLQRFDAGDEVNPEVAKWFTTPPKQVGAKWRGVRA